MDQLNKMKILVAELMDESAIDLLKKDCQVDVKYKMSRQELLSIIPDYHAIIVRSETIIDQEFLDQAHNLKIVGRGGSGLDNIDHGYATKKGVIVANTPESNIISAAEHTIALILSTCRNIAWANNFIKSGEWERKRFKGCELYSKVIGIIGLGRIGALVAERLQGFALKKIVAYDPYIPDSRFDKYNVEKKEQLDDLIKQSDIITIHTPRTQETINIIDSREIAMMKDGVRLVNVARGGLFNEEAVTKGMQSGKIASAGIDVWINEPQKSHALYEFDHFIGTPHLGASTFEAQLRVGIEVAEQVLSGLKGEIVKNAVNIPSFSSQSYYKLSAFINLAEKIGQLYSQVRKGCIKRVDLSFSGEDIHDKSDVKLLSLLALKGILEAYVAETVNFVNAIYIAEQREIEIYEHIELNKTDYSNFIKLKVTEENDTVFEIAGTVFEKKYPRIISILDYDVDIIPEGRLVYIPHKNVSGVIGQVGLAMANFNINISKMIVSDDKKESIMVISVDNQIPQALIDQVKKIEAVLDIKVIDL